MIFGKDSLLFRIGDSDIYLAPGGRLLLLLIGVVYLVGKIIDASE